MVTVPAGDPSSFAFTVQTSTAPYLSATFKVIVAPLVQVVAAASTKVTEKVPLATVPLAEADIVPVVDEAVNVVATACAGTIDNRPKPNADTATSAMRLRSVFVDIFFLSLVELRNFPISARRSC
jgi:hypothetical protein